MIIKTMKQITNIKWQNTQIGTIVALSSPTIMFNKSLRFIFTYYSI